MYGIRSGVITLIAMGCALGFGIVSGPSHAAGPPSGTVSESAPQVNWEGPFLTPTGSSNCGGPNNVACDNFLLSIIPPSFPFDVDIRLQPELNGDWDLQVYNPSGQLIAQAGHNAGVLEQVSLRNPAAGTYTVVAVPFAPAPVTPSYTASATIVQAPGPPGNEPITYVTHVPPFPLGRQAGEPTGGTNWNTDKSLSISGLETLRTTFDDCSSPARATWDDVSFALTSQATADPILFTDSITGRTFVSQLAGETSLLAFTDDDGLSWSPSQGAGLASGVDHQAVGGGPYHEPLTRDPGGPLYPHAVYYCAQAAADAACARSDDGGLTFNQSVPIYTAADCGGLHGAAKVAPDDGTIYVPNKSCAPEQALIVNEASGEAVPPGWVVRRITGSTAASGRFDPSVGIASDGTVYVGLRDGDGHPKAAVSHDRGVTWVLFQDVGIPFGIQNAAFPAVVAGDPDRAAFAFLGTSTGGTARLPTRTGRGYGISTSPTPMTAASPGRRWTSPRTIRSSAG